MVVSDAGHHRIAVFDFDGRWIAALGKTETGTIDDSDPALDDFSLCLPRGLAVDSRVNHLLIADQVRHASISIHIAE